MTLQPAPEPEDLWDAICAQREGAYEKLQEMISSVCSSVLRHPMVPPEARERLLQDVLVSVWKYAGKQGEAPKNLPAFLKWRARGVLSVFRRELQARRQENPVEHAMPIADEHAHPLDGLISEELIQAFKRCREKLSPPLEAVWSARYELGLDPATTAKELGVEPGTVAVRLHRAKQALLECLRNCGAIR